MLVPTDLPAPDPDARAHSERVLERVATEIEDAGGWLDFERYMELVLYAPGLGYYSAGSTKLGPDGDFITAPQMGSAFAALIAPFIGEQLARLDAPRLVELGPGTGQLAADLLTQLEQLGQHPEYVLVEPSADLSQRQRDRLAPWQDRVRWLDGPPAAPLPGILLANEVVDALPVRRFRLDEHGQPLPLGVVLEPQGVHLQEGPFDESLAAEWERLAATLPQVLPPGFVGEFCPRLAPWFDRVTQGIGPGACLLFDYGLDRASYYHSSAPTGRLACFYRHRLHHDPTIFPGLCDITAWVDFSALAQAARAAGFETRGYTTQGLFLSHQLALTSAELSSRSEELRTLLMPGEMGERVKVLWLTRGAEFDPLPGRDLRNRL